MRARYAFFGLILITSALFIFQSGHFALKAPPVQLMSAPNVNINLKAPNHTIYLPTHDPDDFGNLPLIYRNKTSNFNKRTNATCARFPNLFDISISNTHWQTQPNADGTTFHFFNAYYDNRGGESVRVVALLDKVKVTATFQCQFWYEGSRQPDVVPMGRLIKPWVDAWGPKADLLSPYVLTCPLPRQARPASVSVVDAPCRNATNNLRIIYPNIERTREKFVVCVKGLNFPFEDVSVRLIEWIELVLILGATKINIYYFELHPNVRRVLHYYQLAGKVEATPITLAGPVSNAPALQDAYLHKQLIQRRLQEVIPYNDCLYKHVHDFDWVVLHDTDEVIVPRKGSWSMLLTHLRRKNPNANITSFMARNIYFLDVFAHEHEWFADIPPYLHMMQHVQRAREPTKAGSYVKGFHSTRSVLGLHNHYPIVCEPKCLVKDIDLNEAQLQHYRHDCVTDMKSSVCDDFKKNSVMDARVWNYSKKLIERVAKALNDLEIVP